MGTIENLISFLRLSFCPVMLPVVGNIVTLGGGNSTDQITAPILVGGDGTVRLKRRDERRV